MMGLAPKMGKAQAHHLVYAAVGRAMDEGGTLREALLSDPQVTALLSEAKIDALLDPPNYLGSAPAMVDAVLARYETLGA